MSDSHVIDLGKKFSIREMLSHPPRAEQAKPKQEETERQPAAELPPEKPEHAESFDELDPLPSAADAYKAYSRPSNKQVGMLCFLFKGIGFKSLSYGNLESIDLVPSPEAGKSPVLMLLFAGINPLMVQLEGRNLIPLADYLRQHRLAWVRECPTGKDFRDDSATVITGISAKPVGE